ncbi:hypothetical protein F66182_9332 [Fusarium sp. NRRL 66182]|nr:hypothetical protein F66182_9332 [Fusarium sp. NRRL 66182]
MDFQTSTPINSFEHSPAESLMSLPGDSYTSLFDPTTPSASSTMNPMEMMTPKSFIADERLSMYHTIKEEEDHASTPSPSPAPEKKTTKKRKSWGQVLPQPKTNLPPRYDILALASSGGFINTPCRKRAKTEDEKEQRRVERVLRNRRAAQSSRERKRLEVEALEQRNKELEAAIAQAHNTNMRLLSELNQMRRSSGLIPQTSSIEPLPSLSQPLFSTQSAQLVMEELITPSATVDPATISPSPSSPVAESSEEPTNQEPLNETNPEQTESISPDLTQLVPGVANLDAANLGLAPAASDDAAFSLGDNYCLSAAIDADLAVLESGYVSSPYSSAIGDDHLVSHTPTYGLNDDFDISIFLHDNDTSTESTAPGNFAAAIHGLEPKVHEPATPHPSENSSMQPLPGASPSGCDVGGFAVGI